MFQRATDIHVQSELEELPQMFGMDDQRVPGIINVVPLLRSD